MDKIRIGLVEDQLLFRQGMKALLSTWPNFEVVFESADGFSVIDKLKELDRTILNFYSMHQSTFYASTGVYFLGWLAEALEVFVIIYYLGGPATVVSAVSIGALSVFIKGGTFFIPGSLGAQDGGNLLLLKAFGYSDVTGITFALLRRFRELVWIGIGLACLAVLGKKGAGRS